MLKRLLLALLVFGLFAVPAAAQNFVYPIGEDARFHWEDLDRFNDIDLSGEEITVFGPWIEPDQSLINSVLDYFRNATGADVVYSGSDSFEQQIVIDIQAGSPPNLAIFPQPGLAADTASRGGLAPLSDDLRDWVLENYAAGQSWVDLGTYADENGEEQFFGFFYKVDLKSIVWYVPDNFDDAG